MTTDIIALSTVVEALLRDAIAQGERAFAALGTPDSQMIDVRAAHRQLEAIDLELEFLPQCKVPGMSRKQRSADLNDLRRRRVVAEKHVEQGELDAAWGPESVREMDDFSQKLHTLFSELKRQANSSAGHAAGGNATLLNVAAHDAAIRDTVGGAMSRYYQPSPASGDYFSGDEVQLRRLLDLLNELLSAPERAERQRLVQSARTLGISSDGLTNLELGRLIESCMWADIDACEAHDTSR